MKSKPFGALFGLLALVAILGVAPAFGQTSSEVDIQAGAGSSASAACTTTHNCFSPNPITVAPGTEVEWKNGDTLSHTVTSGKSLDDPDLGSVFDSGMIKNGAEFKFTFANAGTYDYLCSVHPWMTGQVIVGNSTPSPNIITVTTNQYSYKDGENIIISGSVNNYVANGLVSVRIINPAGNIVNVDQVDLRSDGTFVISKTAIGTLWQVPGTYQVVAQYGNPNTMTTTTFQFSGSSTIQSGNNMK